MNTIPKPKSNCSLRRTFTSRAKPAWGERFLWAVEGAIERLKFDPAARPKTLFDVRRQPVKDFKFDVLYLDEPDRIWIVALAHYSRKTGYWRKRL